MLGAYAFPLPPVAAHLKAEIEGSGLERGEEIRQDRSREAAAPALRARQRAAAARATFAEEKQGRVAALDKGGSQRLRHALEYFVR